MKVRILTFTTAVLCLTVSFSQTNTKAYAEKWFSAPEYQHASVGIHLADLNTGETIYQLNAEKLLVPASALKLVTSAAALEILGPDYRFQTKIGYTGNIKNGILRGDLVILGGGDPALGSEYFRNHYFNPDFTAAWVQKIKASGIHKIDGNLIFDESLYDDENIPPTWIWEDIGNYYGAGASALSVYDNLFRITFTSPSYSGQPTEIIAIYPKPFGLEFINEVLSSDENRDLAYVFGSPLDAKRVIRGTIPKNRQSFTIKAAMHHPGEMMASVFMERLAEQGVFFTGQINKNTVDQKQLQVVYIQESPGLSEIIRVLNFESMNLFAEHLVKQIAAEQTGKGNRETGINIIRDFWESKEISMENMFMEDGSGLSHFNAVSPVLFTAVLRYMRLNSPNSGIFLQSLPGPGEGTLSQLNPEFFSGDVLHAKSGSMTRVRSYAGYLKTKSGRELVFAVMFNHFSGSHSNLVTDIQDYLSDCFKKY